MAFTKEPTESTRFIVLRNRESGDSFFARYKGEAVEECYRVLGYADTVYDAQRFLYGKAFAEAELKQKVKKELDRILAPPTNSEVEYAIAELKKLESIS